MYSFRLSALPSSAMPVPNEAFVPAYCASGAGDTNTKFPRRRHARHGATCRRGHAVLRGYRKLLGAAGHRRCPVETLVPSSAAALAAGGCNSAHCRIELFESAEWKHDHTHGHEVCLFVCLDVRPGGTGTENSHLPQQEAHNSRNQGCRTTERARIIKTYTLGTQLYESGEESKRARETTDSRPPRSDIPRCP